MVVQSFIFRMHSKWEWFGTFLLAGFSIIFFTYFYNVFITVYKIANDHSERGFLQSSEPASLVDTMYNYLNIWHLCES